MPKPVSPVIPPRIGRGEQLDDRDNEIIIEVDRANQYRSTQPGANEPQGKHFASFYGFCTVFSTHSNNYLLILNRNNIDITKLICS